MTSIDMLLDNTALDRATWRIKLSNMSGKLLGFKAINFDTTANSFCRQQALGIKKGESVIPKDYGYQHLDNLMKVIKHNPHCTFAMWTKRKDFVKRYFDSNEKPDNLIMIYSNPLVGAIMKEPPEYFDRTFNNVPEDKHVELQNCTGQKCIDCMLCYTKGNGVTTIVEKVKSYGKKVANPKNICKACYSMNMLKTFRKTCVPAFKKNSILFASEPLLPEQIPTINAAFVRIAAHGEVMDRSDLGRMKQ